MDSDLIQILKDRGIYDVAIEFGWQQKDMFGGRGWEYPLYFSNGAINTWGKRWKRADEHARQKYGWIPNKPDNARYYLLPGAFDAILDAQQVILASGEPDVLAFRAAGVKNVMCWFGEKSIPDTLIDDLKLMDVLVVVIYPDMDETGMRFTAELAHRLQNTGIQLQAYRLPYEFQDSHGMDINQLWIDSEFHPNDFKHTLNGCEILPQAYYEMYIPADMPQQKQLTASEVELPPAFLQAIASALGVDGFKSSGWSRKNISCLFHEDKSPSAGWHKDGSYQCFSCGKTMNAKETGEHLNIYLIDYLPEQTFHQPDQNGHESPLPPEITDNLPPDQTPVESDYITPKHRNDYVMAQLAKEIHGEVRIRERSFPFPVESLHQFRGFMEMCDTCKITGIIGGSGDGKTQFLETITDLLNSLYNVSGLFFGSEWTDKEMTMRRVQRWSNPNCYLSYQMIKRHLSYLGYQQDGYEDNENPMTPLSPEQIDEYDRVMNTINHWSGSMEYFGGSATLEQTLNDMRIALARERNTGKNILFIAFDYAQLLKAKSWDNSTNRYEYAVELVKDFAIEQNVHVFMTSQVNKVASAGSKEGETLNADSANYIRKDKFNLMLILDRQHYKNKQGQWIETNAYYLTVGKASMGGKPEGYTDTVMRVPMVMNPYRLFFSETDWRKINAKPFNLLEGNEFCPKTHLNF